MYLSFLVLSDILPFSAFPDLPLHFFYLIFPICGMPLCRKHLKATVRSLLTVLWSHPFYIFRRLSALRFLYLTSFCIPAFLRNKGFLPFLKSFRLCYVFYQFFCFSEVFLFMKDFRFCFYFSEPVSFTCALVSPFPFCDYNLP